jgi:hypothetical protein
MQNTTYLRRASVLLVILLGASSGAQQLETMLAVPPPLSAEQVVENLLRMNRERAQALHGYRGTRIYRIEYRGFPGSRSGEMVVDMTYQAPATKEFTIRQATGSKTVLDVFRKLLAGEQEALDEEHQKRTALTAENYTFTLLGYENSPAGGALYVLAVEPKSKSKFLYRGRIWVDAEDFAVSRIEAEPAKSPSFWIKNTAIEHLYLKVLDFWLPAHNQSVSTVRLGGRAELTIEYRDYQITGAGPTAALGAGAQPDRK